MPTALTIVDAFTAVPFAGNPAAVCLLDETRDDRWMQSVATEMNLSDTAFVAARDDGYDLRWFTPSTEVDLCGHATLATGHVLREAGMLADGALARFHTRSGELTARSVDGMIELDFPLLPSIQCELPPAIAAALGAAPEYCANTNVDGSGEDRYLVVLASEREVRSLRPDFAALRAAHANVIVSARAESDAVDFVSRYFAGAHGVDEDPVTGSAHCALLPYWSAILGRDALVGFQASRRGGTVHCRLDGDRAKLRGHAVTVARGELL